ncbi:MAG: hypothetical protein AYK19_16445 [Theionarchaea archaeon DG-70-1]|nr:MAG: hypothetical protein AYK19_16445 [Theionarchaea archaeon DG-70-1]
MSFQVLVTKDEFPTADEVGSRLLMEKFKTHSTGASSRDVDPCDIHNSCSIHVIDLVQEQFVKCLCQFAVRDDDMLGGP